MAAPEPDQLCTSSGTILLVEDEEAVRRLAGMVLKAGGYTVLEARDGTEALAMAEAHLDPIRLLITDLIMPNIGGWELARRLRSVRPGLKILLMSGYTEWTLDDHGVSEGDLAFLQKPFTPADLLRKVREVV